MQKHIFTCCLLLLAGASLLQGQRINDLTGINAQPNDPLNLQKRFSWVRTWHDWSLDVGYLTNCPNNCNPGECAAGCAGVAVPSRWEYRWSPSYYQTGTKLNFDTYFGTLGKRGIPILKGIAPQFRGYQNYPGGCGHFLEQKPVCLTVPWCNPTPDGCTLPNTVDFSDPAAPASYHEHSLWLSLFAAKYGQASAYPLSFVDGYTLDQGLTIARDNIQYIEDNNEPNKNWWDSQAALDSDDTHFYLTPSQFSAMLWADYNGDGNTMLAGASGNEQVLGVANASGGIKFVMGGLAGLNGQYLKDMAPAPKEDWVANFHHYCTNLSAAQDEMIDFFNGESGEFFNYKGILLDGINGYGVSPEADKLRDKLKWLANPNDPDHNLPAHSELWLSEFGYDSFAAGETNMSGVEACPIEDGGDGDYDSQKVQAQWLTRGVLEAAHSRAVDKMMLYELKDAPTANNGSYSYSGLLTEDEKFKRSWFYIMTLKRVLGEYTFQQAVKNGQDGFMVQQRAAGSNGAWLPADEETQVRVYEFRKGLNDRIFAIWSPTEDAVSPFEVRIDFPNDEAGPLSDYPLIGSATLHQIEELSEFGRRWNWASHVNGQTITINNEVLASETPVFLHINKSYPSYPAPPAAATGISCGIQSCCRSVELAWTPPAGGTRNTLIYYKEKESPTDPCPDWDLVSWTLFSNQLGPNRSSATVTGLEEGESYCFVVIPISHNGGLPPDNIEALAPFDGCGPSGDCASCMLNIGNNEIALGAGTDLTLQNLRTILGIADTPVSCPDVNPNDCPNGNAVAWTEWKDPATFPEANTFYINFTSPKRIKAILAQDWIGNGDVRVQYEDCACPNHWRILSTLPLEGSDVCDGNHYQIKHISTNTLVKRLRITKMHSDAVIRRLFFCGNNEACPILPSELGTPSGFEADEIRKNSATLRWEAAKHNQSDPQSHFVEEYKLSVSQQISTNNQLVNPVVYHLSADPLELDVMHRLEGLAPATTYYAELVIEAGPCPTSPPPTLNPLLVSFTTESELGERGKKEEKPLSTRTEDPYSVLLRPNPANEDVLVSITSGELEKVLLMDGNGRVLRQWPASSASISVNLDGIAPGTYWVRTVRTDRTPLTVLLMKR